MTIDVRTGAPDPEDAHRRFERVAAALDAAHIEWASLPSAARDLVVLCCQKAPYLATLLARDGHRLGRVARSAYLRREKPAAVIGAELAAWLFSEQADDEDDFRQRLRRFRADEMVRLGARELALGNPREVGRELAHLADAAFDAAIRFRSAHLEARYGKPRFIDDDGRERDAELVVIGMGKMGGQELNFSSDVDIIYVYSSDQGDAGSLSLHEYFSKLCKQVTGDIGDVTEDDVVFRVDLRLRPEGSVGAIANSLHSTERYYETWGRPWERQAWLKARPSAGSQSLGREVMDTLRPFIYPHSISINIIDTVSDLNQRIKTELDSAGIDSGFDVKNGVGGIREIEFFVQALQMVHGGRRPSLRERCTVAALEKLMFAGLITENEHRILNDGYRFLRHVEHLLQLDSGRQTQRLPSEPTALHLFARRMQYADAQSFLDALAALTKEVSHLFATLGAPDPQPPDAALALVEGSLSPDREVATLAEMGFRDAERASELLTIARRKPLSPFSPVRKGPAARIAPELIAELAASPDPDQALGYLVEICGRRSSFSSVWQLFDVNPAIMRATLALFATSAFLSKRFIHNPNLIDILIDIGNRRPTRSPQELREELSADLGQADSDNQELQWNRLAAFKNAQLLRIGLADVGGDLDCHEVSAELSALAEIVLDQALKLICEAMEERHGVPRDSTSGSIATLAILALGKLGGRELGYASDLDVIFVYEGDGQSDGARPIDNVTYMTRVAQRLMSALHTLHPGGRLYELDTRLRPSGSQGLLVSSLRAWQNYHQGEARLWEKQALIKLRPVAGDPALGNLVAQAAAEYAYGHTANRADRQGQPTSARDIAAYMTDMRNRIERELAGGRDEHDIKSGRGGIIDIEFASQYLQLVHGHVHKEIRTRSTVEALENAAALGLAPPQDCSLLIDGYHFLRTLEHRIRIVHDQSVHRLPRNEVELDKLARRIGYLDASSLQRDFAQWTREVRSAYERLLSNVT